jgi:hypothetical protein
MAAQLKKRALQGSNLQNAHTLAEQNERLKRLAENLMTRIGKLRSYIKRQTRAPRPQRGGITYH